MDHIILNPNSNKELFYSRSNRESECIGHLRGDFGRDGNGFWTSWFPHEAAAYNTPEFRVEFQSLVDSLRKSLLKDRPFMRRYLREHPNLIEQSGSIEQHGYFNFYIYCYLRGREASA